MLGCLSLKVFFIVMFEYYLGQGIFLIILFVAIPLSVASFFGLIISFLQATTQIQEQSITFFVKITSVVITFLITGSWMIEKYKNYLEEGFIIISKIN